MRTLQQLIAADDKWVIGLMSGTSADGIEAVLTRIQGFGLGTRLQQIAHLSVSYEEKLRDCLLRLAAGESGGSAELCRMNALLGSLFADACEALCRKAGIPASQIDLVGCHGHTFYHIPVPENYLGSTQRSTLQLGEASYICERLDTIAVSDFRVRDVAAGGLGAPIVPYTEFLLYRDPTRNVALQNIGGIGNITFLKKESTLEDVLAFDTGPGNMVMDALAARYDSSLRYDPEGQLAARGTVNEALLAFLLDDPYYTAPLPKTTGREKYTADYVDVLMEKATELGIGVLDALATATMLTAKTIALAAQRHQPFDTLDRLIVGGGGSLNPTLMAMIAACMPGVEVLTNEALGFDSQAKEAIAMALLANETIHGSANNACGATGATHRVVMGKISQ